MVLIRLTRCWLMPCDVTAPHIMNWLQLQDYRAHPIELRNAGGVSERNVGFDHTVAGVVLIDMLDAERGKSDL